MRFSEEQTRDLEDYQSWNEGRSAADRLSLFDYARTREDLLALAGPVMAAAVEGSLKAWIDRVLPLEDAVLAHELLEGRGTMGKLLLST